MRRIVSPIVSSRTLGPGGDEPELNGPAGPLGGNGDQCTVSLPIGTTAKNAEPLNTSACLCVVLDQIVQFALYAERSPSCRAA